MNAIADEQRIITRFTNAAGVETHYYQAGLSHETTILLLHGMSASADSFREIIAELSLDFWTVAPDIPGFGHSADTQPYTFPQLIRWLQAFLEALEISSCHVVGHSFGGALAVSYALTAPDRVDSLILLAPSVLRSGKYPQWLRKFAQTRLSEAVLQLGVSASRLMLQRQIRAAFYDPSRFELSLWQRRRRDYRHARASAAVLRASALHDIRSDLHRIQQRSCIVWGREDPVLEPHDAAILSELMPKSYTEVHLLAECGHVPHIEQRERVLTIISQFLERS